MPRPTHPYIRTWQGWLYLAVVRDLFSRKIVGWAAGPSIHREVVLNAVLMAVRQRRPRGTLIHSDQGTQYGSDAWRRFCRSNRLEPSMSRKGNCWDNAVAESFFSSLKKERIKKLIYKNRELARADVAQDINSFYNSTRRHSHLGGVSPDQFEAADTPRREHLHRILGTPSLASVGRLGRQYSLPHPLTQEPSCRASLTTHNRLVGPRDVNVSHCTHRRYHGARGGRTPRAPTGRRDADLHVVLRPVEPEPGVGCAHLQLLEAPRGNAAVAYGITLLHLFEDHEIEPQIPDELVSAIGKAWNGCAGPVVPGRGSASWLGHIHAVSSRIETSCEHTCLHGNHPHRHGAPCCLATVDT